MIMRNRATTTYFFKFKLKKRPNMCAQHMMTRVLIWLGMSGALLSACVAQGASVDLVRNGKPAATIVIAKDPTRVVQFAVAELQHHIEKITGTKLLVASGQDKVSGARVLVGDSAATRALGLKNADFKHQEYLIRVAPGTVVLMGRDKIEHGKVDYDKKVWPDGVDLSRDRKWPDYFDEQGTLYAVYDFLERFGVRWYGPTELGVVCPTKASLTATGPDVRRRPAILYRERFPSYPYSEWMMWGIWDKPNHRQMCLFWRRLRHGGFAFQANHSFYGYYDRFWKKNPEAPQLWEGSHPEYFAQGYEGQPPQMCFTNEGFIRQVIRDARDYFDGHKAKPRAVARGNYFALVPQDNASWCKCPKCQAEMDKSVAPEWALYASASDYVFGFVNKVAREVRKTHPDKTIACLAYSSFTRYPKRVKLEPNVAVQVCMAVRNWWAPWTEKRNMELYTDWVKREKGPQIFLWLYYTYPEQVAFRDKFKCFPGFFAHTADRQIKMFARDGIKGAFLCGLGEQVDTYITFKLFDDPSLDVDALLDEFFTLYYGHAAEPMRRLYLAIEKTFSDPNNYPEPIRTGQRGANQTAEFAWGRLGTETRMKQFAKLMAEARRLARTEVEKKRVALFDEAIWGHMVEGRKQYVERTK